MKCQEFTQKKFFHIANEIFKEAVNSRDIQALEELSLTTRVLHDMNFIKFNIAYTITWNIFNAIELIKKEKKKINKEYGYDNEQDNRK